MLLNPHKLIKELWQRQQKVKHKEYEKDIKLKKIFYSNIKQS